MRDDGDRRDRKVWQVYRLADAVVRGTITAESARRLDELLRTDAEARRLYVEYMVDSAAFCRWSRALPPVAAAGAAAPLVPQPPAFSPVLAGVAFHYATVGLVMGALLLGAWTLQSLPRSVGTGAPGRQQGRLSPFSGPSFTDALADEGKVHHGIGRVTATSNCQWVDPLRAARVSEPIFEGRTYFLASGLLEISYDVGVSAILEGPAVYTVDAVNGGSLLEGKLTIRACKVDRAGKGGQSPFVRSTLRAAPANGACPPFPLTPPPHAARFCVVTGGAVVKNAGDREAQFGIEVDQSRATYLRVLSGLVTIRTPYFGPRVVPPGEYAWTGAGANHDGLLIFRPGPPPKKGPPPRVFVTEMPKSTPADPAGS
jgi:hypothetical protein